MSKQLPIEKTEKFPTHFVLIFNLSKPESMRNVRNAELCCYHVSPTVPQVQIIVIKCNLWMGWEVIDFMAITKIAYNEE